MAERKDFDDVVRIKKKNKKQSAALAIVMTLVLAVVGVYYCFAELFVYKNVKLASPDGVEIPYSEEQLKEGLEIQEGVGLYSIDNDELKNRIKYNLPYIDKANIAKRLPDTIVIDVKQFAKPTYYTEVGGDLYILGNDLKVLEKTKDIEKIEIYSLVLLELSDVRKCIEGEMLGIDNETSHILSDLRQTLVQNEVFSDIVRIDIKNKFNINLLCTSRFSVKLGDKSNLETKILLMKTVINDKKDIAEGGTIDISDEAAREAVFRRYG